jgi:hypothetical protein
MLKIITIKFCFEFLKKKKSTNIHIWAPPSTNYVFISACAALSKFFYAVWKYNVLLQTHATSLLLYLNVTKELQNIFHDI